MSHFLTFSSLENEVGYIAKNSYDQGRTIDDSEIEYLVKMTKYVVMKIRKQVMEGSS